MSSSELGLLFVRYGVLSLTVGAWSVVLALAGVPDPALFGLLVFFGFIVGLRWRMVVSSQKAHAEAKALTWSGASTGAFIGLAIGLAIARTWPSPSLLVTFLIAFDVLYFAGKLTCLYAGCCNATRAKLPVPLPALEAAGAAAVILAGVVLLTASALVAMLVVIHAQYLLRLASRLLRDRFGGPAATLELAQVFTVDLSLLLRHP